jgi:SAM-dependent methyltransferase
MTTTITPDHLGGSLTPDSHTFMPDVWSRLIQDYAIRSMIDVGCGPGYTAAWFLEHFGRAGRVLGLEGDPGALAIRRCDPIVSHDFTLGPFVPIDRYDLGWCAEFVEHVEEQFIPNWMAALRRCRYVAMTFATPGQGGHHHVCERDESFWLEQFTAADFDHVPEETARLRASSRGEPYGRRTLTFFRNRA